MNPLALPGPQFLVFYGLFALAVLLILHFGRRARENAPFPKVDVKDPYLFACLNGGPEEVVRVSTVGLVDRGLLKLTGGTAHTESSPWGEVGLPGIDAKVLSYFRGGASVSSAVKNKELLAAARADYEHRLRGFGLIPDAGTLSVRRIGLALALAALICMGGAKIWWAWSIGRTNIGYLVILMVFAIATAAYIWNPYRTRLGDDYLVGVQSLFANLRQRASSLQPGGATRDLLWLTALFGVATLPATSFPAIAYVWPRPVSSGKSSGGGGSGGCGGGCGGGGGGCGGCGS